MLSLLFIYITTCFAISLLSGLVLAEKVTFQNYNITAILESTLVRLVAWFTVSCLLMASFILGAFNLLQKSRWLRNLLILGLNSLRRVINAVSTYTRGSVHTIEGSLAFAKLIWLQSKIITTFWLQRTGFTKGCLKQDKLQSEKFRHYSDL